MRVGIIGCGNISDVYVRNAKLFNDIEKTFGGINYPLGNPLVFGSGHTAAHQNPAEQGKENK